MTRVPEDRAAARERDWQTNARLLRDFQSYCRTDAATAAEPDFILAVRDGLTYPVADGGWVDWDRYPPDGHGFPGVA